MRPPPLPALSLVALVAFLPAAARAGDDDLSEALDGLSGAKALALVEALSAPAMKGRRSGFEGGRAVENWVIERFSEFGLDPADAAGTYLEPFAFQASQVTAPITLAIGEAPLAYGRDFLGLVQTGGGGATAEAVFCGYGIARPDRGWDDYAGVDVKGRVVLALRGAPPGRADELADERYIGAKCAAAADRGAAGLLLVDGAEPHGGTILQRFVRPHLPALWISAAAADRILAPRKQTVDALKAEHAGGAPGRSFGTGVQVTLRVDATWRVDARGHNALGAIRGRDPDLKDEVVLVGAHMDHLGLGPDGSVFPGADDNASGTAALVHLADVLTANRWRPRRTVVFCAFGAEEEGLLGSQALASRYPFPGRVVCVLNVDMVGQGEPVVAVDGGGAYPAMQARLAAALPAALQATTRFGARTGPHGDHWPFHERGVPAFFVATKGPHPHYHTPQDVAANVDPACLEAAVRTVGALVVSLGEHPAPLADDLALPNYLLREGPRFAPAEARPDGLVLPAPRGAEAVALAGEALERVRADGIGGLLVHVPATADAGVAWRALEALEAAEGSAWRLVRRASDVGRAFDEGRLALLPSLDCARDVAADPARVADVAAMGYRVLAPFAPGPDAPAPATALLEALRAARVAVDARALAAAHWPAVRRALGDLPVLRAGHPVAAPGGALDRDTLWLLDAADPASWNVSLRPASESASCLLLGSGAEMPGVLAAWGGTQPAGWDLPGSPQRQALRAVLGGRLVEWLRRTER